jgi:hypothetical protein
LTKPIGHSDSQGVFPVKRGDKLIEEPDAIFAPNGLNVFRGFSHCIDDGI